MACYAETMPRRKLGEEGLRNIQRSGQTHTITLPIHMVRRLGWREHQKVFVTMKGESLHVVDWKPKKKSSK